ncbi:hypothetical protein OSB04_032207 [Centaurea solstitialis]|uniref:Uncharacterized protein n=1 Tax=Centaurea solstitialis TaxID=347529 RepID=A0AA38SAK9_9ASTR|nr:hypothetical protein OSB04_032207 [Centaurea solstitialis]
MYIQERKDGGEPFHDPESLVMFMSDMSGKEPLYKKAFVFFSSSIPKDFVGRIKEDTTVVPRIGALREMNLEYFPIDNQAFSTDHGEALEDLYAEDAENSRYYNNCLKSMATRIATVFASLKELPVVRYRVKETDEANIATGTPTFRDAIPKKVALAVWEYITSYKTTIPNYPQIETCDLLIVDRSVDLVAPIIHEWTYDAMCHDLIDLNGNKYVMEVPSKSGGKPERKEFVLEDHDPVWVEMRFLHIADASEKLSDKMDKLMSSNKAAQLQQKLTTILISRVPRHPAAPLRNTHTIRCQRTIVLLPAVVDVHRLTIRQPRRRVGVVGFHDFRVRLRFRIQTRDTSELSTRDIQKMVQDLPAYNEQMEKLSLHVEIAGKINQVISQEGLRDLGQIEQDIVFGDAGHEELLEYLSEHEDGGVENMVRLMMIYALADPEKFEGENGAKLLEMANLSQYEMRMIENMRLLEGPVKKKKQETKGGLFNFNREKSNNALRKDKPGEEETWALFRFFPVLEELIEKIDKRELPNDEYKCINDPSTRGVSAGGRGGAQQSRRSRRPTAGKASDDGHSTDAVQGPDLKHMGQRIFLRICHKLTAKLRREVVLGSTSLDDPPMYLTKLKMLTMKLPDDMELTGIPSDCVCL